MFTCILLGSCASASHQVIRCVHHILSDQIFALRYDEEADQILHYERVSLIDLEKIEMGPHTW